MASASSCMPCAVTLCGAHKGYRRTGGALTLANPEVEPPKSLS